MASQAPPIVLETGNNPRHSIIWLHGLGADGHDFVPIVDELALPVPVRYIFPHAPMRPVTINGGFVMRAWYDIVGTTLEARQDRAGIRASQALVESLIGEEAERGVALRNILLAGFSQGGAMALHTALRQDMPLGGVVALSGYLPLSDLARSELRTGAMATPIFMAHGLTDPVVPYLLGVSSRDALRKLGLTVEWHDYPMQHSVCEEELRDIARWLATRLATP